MMLARVDLPLSKADAASRASARLARVERHLGEVFFKAIIDGRELISLLELSRMIAEASSSGILKADDLPEIAWNVAGVDQMRLLGRPYTVLEADVDKLDKLWAEYGAHYLARAGDGLTQSMGDYARRGVMLPPPVFADLGDAWGFLDGRNRYLYTRRAGHASLPLAVPLDDAARLEKLVGLARPANMAGRSSYPVGTPGRPYADISEATERVGLFVANRLASAIMAAAMAVGEDEAARLSREISSRQRARKLETALDFGTPNAGALAELRLDMMRLIREFSDEQRAAVLAALRDGVAQGLNPIDIARKFRSTVGLTAAQEGYIRNYQRSLERIHTDMAAKADALGRKLRDARYDRTIANAAKAGKALTPAQIEAMTARYRERWIAHRAKTIARTEALRAVHMAEASVWHAAVASGDIVAAEVIETWNTAHDERVRMSHRMLDRKTTTPLGKGWDTITGAHLRFPGDPLGPAHEVINCRCVVTRQLTDVPAATETPPADGELEGETVADEIGAMRAAQGLDELVTPKTPKGYRDLARRVNPGGIGDDVLEIPYGYGRDLDGIVYDAATGTRGATTLAEAMTPAELTKLADFYRQQLLTQADRKLVGYIDAFASSIPKGTPAKIVGKTINIPMQGITFNARIAAAQGTTILQIRMPKGQPLAFVDAAKQTIALPPGTKAVIKSVRYLTAEEYLAETGYAGAKSGPAILNAGKKGFRVVEVEIVDTANDARRYISTIEAQLAGRTIQLSALEREIAQNNATVPLVEPAPTVKLEPKKGNAEWSAYAKEGFKGANDTARNVLNKIEPPTVIAPGQGKGPYYNAYSKDLAAFPHEAGQPGRLGMFRHEMGHHVDYVLGPGKQLPIPKSTEAFREVLVEHERWNVAVDSQKYATFRNVGDVARFMSKEYKLSLQELARNDHEMVEAFLRSKVTKFKAETGFDLYELFPQTGSHNLVRAFEFAEALNNGNVKRLTAAIGERHLGLHVTSWEAQEDIAHAFYDLIGSVSRLEYGGGHGATYYLRKGAEILADNLKRGQTVGDWNLKILTDENTGEAFANWFNLYTRGPGEREVLRRLMPGLNEKFESFLKAYDASEGGGLFGIRFW